YAVSAKRAARSSRRSLDRALGGSSGYIDLPYRAVVPEGLQEKELFGKGLHPFHTQRHAWRRARIEHDEIGVRARLKRAHMLDERQRLGVAARDLPERGERIELFALQRDHLVAFVHCPQHGIIGAAADIGRGSNTERLRPSFVAMIVEKA